MIYCPLCHNLYSLCNLTNSDTDFTSLLAFMLSKAVFSKSTALSLSNSFVKFSQFSAILYFISRFKE